jgi:hypothetical protein
MWRLSFKLFSGMLVASVFTNAVAVYLLHDVDADEIGNFNSAYRGLMLEFLVYSIIVTAIFLLTVWTGSQVMRSRVDSSARIGFILGTAVILIQYPAEFIVRWRTGHSSNLFLLAYMLLAPIGCASIVLVDARKRRSAS